MHSRIRGVVELRGVRPQCRIFACQVCTQSFDFVDPTARGAVALRGYGPQMCRALASLMLCRG